MTNITDREQLQHYYEHQLPAELRDVLTKLSGLMGHDTTGQIFDAYMRWIVTVNDPEIIKTYHEDRNRAAVPDEEVWMVNVPEYGNMTVEQFLAIAVMGLRLIYHVDYNSDLNANTQRAGEVIVEHTEQLAKQLDVDNLPQVSIHGGKTYWTGEVSQTAARTYDKLNRPDDAQTTLRIHLAELKEKEKHGITLTPGEKSAEAVLLYRLGGSEGNLSKRILGLETEIANSDVQFNRDRLLTLAFGTFKSSLNRGLAADLLTRLQGVVKSANGVWLAAKHDPKETLEFLAHELHKAA